VALFAVVVGRIPAYLPRGTGIAAAMPEIIARPHLSGPFLTVGALVVLALGATLLLWAHYGTTVFFETIRAGFSACFG
jgi:hypothetical protein